MSFVIVCNRRIKKSNITAFRKTDETDSSSPCIKIRNRGKIEIMYPGDMTKINTELSHLKEVYDDFVEVGGWYISKSIIREYRVYSDGEKGYISFNTSMNESMVVHFSDIIKLNECVNNIDDQLKVI